ncbi:MAG: hypothetical protein KA138_06090, partial [Saprospiraceae bacterium]|nr:hypothetical protein [Saprospiraceae bacterium]
QLLFRDLNNNAQIIDRYIDGQMVQIKENTTDYESEKDEHYSIQASQSRKLANSFQEKVYKIWTEIWVDNPTKWLKDSKDRYDFKRPASEKELEYLKLAAHDLCDSLMLYGEYDEVVTNSIKYLLAPDSNTEFWEMAKSANVYQSGVLLKDLMLRADLACVATLHYLLSKTSPGIICTDWLPIVSAKKSAILPGQTYNAEIFLSEYSRYDRNTTIKVNGKPYPIKDGLVHFSQRYATPGEKKYKVEIEIKNPVTKTVKSYNKEFALLVVDSCL